MTRVLVVVALLATLVGCGNDESIERAYNLGHSFAGQVLGTVEIATETELLDECAVQVRDKTVYEPQSDEANAFRDGCADRWDDPLGDPTP